MRAGPIPVFLFWNMVAICDRVVLASVKADEPLTPGPYPCPRITNLEIPSEVFALVSQRLSHPSSLVWSRLMCWDDCSITPSSSPWARFRRTHRFHPFLLESQMTCVTYRTQRIVLVKLANDKPDSTPSVQITFIGHGNFGCVYGVAVDGQFVAVAKTLKDPRNRVTDKELDVLRIVSSC